jgi:hypothetical protein
VGISVAHLRNTTDQNDSIRERKGKMKSERKPGMSSYKRPICPDRVSGSF